MLSFFLISCLLIVGITHCFRVSLVSLVLSLGTLTPMSVLMTPRSVLPTRDSVSSKSQSGAHLACCVCFWCSVPELHLLCLQYCAPGAVTSWTPRLHTVVLPWAAFPQALLWHLIRPSLRPPVLIGALVPGTQQCSLPVVSYHLPWFQLSLCSIDLTAVSPNTLIKAPVQVHL